MASAICQQKNDGFHKSCCHWCGARAWEYLFRTTAPNRRRRVCGGWSSNMCPCDPRKLLCHVDDLGSFQWFGLWVFEQSCTVPWQLLTAVCDGDGIVCFGGFLCVMIRTKDCQDWCFFFRGIFFCWSIKMTQLRSIHVKFLCSQIPTLPTFQLLPGRLDAFKFSHLRSPSLGTKAFGWDDLGPTCCQFHCWGRTSQ